MVDNVFERVTLEKCVEKKSQLSPEWRDGGQHLKYHNKTEQFINTTYSTRPTSPKSPRRITTHSATLIGNIFTNDIANHRWVRPEEAMGSLKNKPVSTELTSESFLMIY